MTDTSNYLPRSVHVKPFNWELILMMSDHSKKPVWVQMNSSNIAIFTASYHNIVSDRYQGIHTVRMAWELVRVQSILVLARRKQVI